MIDQTILDNAVVILQLAYTAAQSNCVVTSDIPEPWNEPTTPVLILYEGAEDDALIGGAPSQMRGTPGPPAYPYKPDVMVAEYRLPSITQQGNGITFADAQRVKRADKMVLANVFKDPPIAALNGHVPLTLDGACMEAGKSISFRPAAGGGPYEAGDSQGSVRFIFRAYISIRTLNH